MKTPYGSIVELLALTGNDAKKSRGQPGTNSTSIDPFGRYRAAGPKMRSHTLSICHRRHRVLAAIPRKRPWVFSINGNKPFSRFSAYKRKLDALAGVNSWRLHDLRRTCVSGMARLGVAPHVADKVLNHQAGTISGVAAVYQRHDFIAERKAGYAPLGQTCTSSAGPKCRCTGNSASGVIAVADLLTFYAKQPDLLT